MSVLKTTAGVFAGGIIGLVVGTLAASFSAVTSIAQDTEKQVCAQKINQAMMAAKDRTDYEAKLAQIPCATGYMAEMEHNILGGMVITLVGGIAGGLSMKRKGPL